MSTLINTINKIKRISSNSRFLQRSLTMTNISLLKLEGRKFYESIGSPKKIVAPMVEQSELAWRILSRKYGADLCYTPMFHAKNFVTSKTYREDNFFTLDGDEKIDRPLIVQFCANDPDYLLQAAQFIEDKCDAIDLNLGCPQGIAKKGNYGAFLMDDWDLIYKLINNLHLNLKIPVTAKIRVFKDKERTLDYAKMVLKAGAQFLTIHGRTREMKGQFTDLADWDIIRYVRDNLPKETVIFANGNILYQDDVPRCLKITNTDAVMSAEANLMNPAVFNNNTNINDNNDIDIDTEFPRVDKLLREYFEILKTTPGQASIRAAKTHTFKLCNSFFAVETDIRNQLGRCTSRNLSSFEEIVIAIEEKVSKIYSQENIKVLDVIKLGELQEWGGRYRTVPYWRCQPYFRKVYGVSGEERIKSLLSSKSDNNEKSKRKVEVNGNANVNKRKVEDKDDITEKEKAVKKCK